MQVFEFTGPDGWFRRGGDIDGEAHGDQSGYLLAISDDGSILAVGAIFNDGNGTDKAGHVRVYQYNTTDGDWVQHGSDIDGEAEGDKSGFSVAISANGASIAIGAPLNDGNGNDAGHIRVYDFNILDKAWVKRSADLYGEAANHTSGLNVAMSADGTVVGIIGRETDYLRIMKWTTCSTSQPSMPPSSTLNVSFQSTATYSLSLIISKLCTDTHSPFLYIFSI